MQALGVLDVDSLDVGVEALLGVLLVVTLAGDADTETEGDTLDTGFPDLLVELGVDTDVLGTLLNTLATRLSPKGRLLKTYHSLLSEGADLLDGLGSTLLEADAVALYFRKRSYNQSSARMPSARENSAR